MKFKMNDRVKTIDMPNGMVNFPIDLTGTIVDIDYWDKNYDETMYGVKLDHSKEIWWYSEDRIISIESLTIPVGTVVKLTGKVAFSEEGSVMVSIDGSDLNEKECVLTIKADALEIIHEPFKAGDIVRSIHDDNEWVVVTDEKDGQMLAARPEVGYEVRPRFARDFKRRS